MKSMFKLFGITALVAVIGFTAACSNGSTGGGGQQPTVPLKETYVSYDELGNEYKLVITEATNGRALDPNKKYTYSLTITLVNGTVKISTGTAKINDNTSIILTHSGTRATVTVTVSGGESGKGVTSFSVDIPVDNGPAVPKPGPLPYTLNETGNGYIIIAGESFVKNGVANIPATFRNLPVTAIGEGSFTENQNLTTIKFEGNNLKTIGEGAFANCKNLTGVTIPAGVTTIGDMAFGWCDNLSSVTIPAGVTYIGNMAFMDANLISVTIPASVTAFGDNERWGAFAGCKKLTTVTFESGSKLEAISWGTFADCPSLSVITIPASVTYIGEWAFGQCKSLTNITIPAGVTHIDAMAFENCTSITSIIIPAGVTAIGWGTFGGWTSSQTINVRGHSSQAEADAAWWGDWRDECEAVIKYWNGSSYQ